MSKLVIEAECLEAALKPLGINSVKVSQDELLAVGHGITIHVRAPHLPISAKVQDLTVTLEAIQFIADGIHIAFSIR